jgi:DNA mismatch repair protein MutS
VPGGADKSYGIYVAKLAGLPNTVIHRAQEVLSGLERSQFILQGDSQADRKSGVSPQLPLFDGHRQLADEISKLDIDSMTPLEAINKLYELKQKSKNADNI